MIALQFSAIPEIILRIPGTNSEKSPQLWACLNMRLHDVPAGMLGRHEYEVKSKMNDRRKQGGNRNGKDKTWYDVLF